jgi:hypothetical protein
MDNVNDKVKLMDDIKVKGIYMCFRMDKGTWRLHENS